MSAVVPLDPQGGADELLALWNGTIGDEFPLDSRLFSQQLRLDTDPRACFAVRGGDGRLSGAVLAKRAARPGASGAIPAAGYISFILTAPDRRGRGVGGDLLDAAFAWLAERGAATVSLGGDRYHFFPGRPIYAAEGSEALRRLAASRGFEPAGLEYDLVAEIGRADPAGLGRSSGDGPESAVTDPAAGFEYGSLRRDEAKAFSAFMRACFPGRWADEMAEGLAAGMDPRDVLLARDAADGSIAGFARICDAKGPVLAPGVYWRAAMREAPGGLGPIGVDAAKRGSGVGLALLRYGVAELEARGVRTMAVDWTDLVDFYGKIGFRVWKRYEATIAKTSRPRR